MFGSNFGQTAQPYPSLSQSVLGPQASPSPQFGLFGSQAPGQPAASVMNAPKAPEAWTPTAPAAQPMAAIPGMGAMSPDALSYMHMAQQAHQAGSNGIGFGDFMKMFGQGGSGAGTADAAAALAG